MFIYFLMAVSICLQLTTWMHFYLSILDVSHVNCGYKWGMDYEDCCIVTVEYFSFCFVGS